MSPYLCWLRRLSLLFLLAVVTSCSEDTDAKAPSMLDQSGGTQEETQSSTENDTKANNKAAVATHSQLTETTAEAITQPVQAICSGDSLSKDELMTSVAITTDLFYAFYPGSSFDDPYGNRFDFYSGSYSLQLTDDLTVTDFRVASHDIKTLISHGEFAEAKVSDLAYVKFTFHTNFTFTSTQKDFLTDLSAATQSELLEYEFKQLFDDLTGAFELSVNGRAFYSSNNTSQFSYELSDMHRIMAHPEDVGTDSDTVTENLAQFEVTATVTYTVDAAKLRAHTSFEATCTATEADAATVNTQNVASDDVDAQIPASTQQTSADSISSSTEEQPPDASSPGRASPVESTPVQESATSAADMGEMTLDEACHTPGTIVYCEP